MEVRALGLRHSSVRLASLNGADGDPQRVPLVFGVELKATGELIGHVGLSPLFQDVEVGFAIEQAHQRQGLATQAVRAICTWATERFKLYPILGVTAEYNIASQGVLLRAGFIHKEERTMNFQGENARVVIYVFQKPTSRDAAGESSNLINAPGTRRF